VSDVKPLRRDYRSALRDRQAADTREAVLTAARELFLTNGYGATTIEQIAARAGVSKPTVFSAVGSKQAVMAALRTVALRGDDEAATVAEREPWQRVLAEPDPYRAVELEVAHLADLWSRWAELKEVLRGAASSGEPSLRELWAAGEEQRRIAAQRFVTTLAEKAPLRDGLTPADAVDITWAQTAPEHYHALVAHRGWSRARYERWLIDTLTHALLPPKRPTQPVRRVATP
jgi:TetR/AcrR family transcriptional regulator, regulator of autoinduction and epiphytic fitness